jgi:4-amino-4-deoxy-L-arabinose transferase-like glycosyltransferase
MNTHFIKNGIKEIVLEKKFLLLLLGVDFFGLLLRLIWVKYGNIDLFAEEAQYWLWSKNLDLSYYSKPPLIAYVNFLSTSLIGTTELGVRINAMIIGFILPLLIFQFSKILSYSDRIAFFAAIILMVMPFYNIISLVFTTDSLVVLFGLLTQIYLFKAFKTNGLKFWLFAGIFLGLANLSKPAALLFYPVIILYLYIFKRELIMTKGFCVLIFTSVLLISPVIIWLAKNNGVMIKHIYALSGIEKGNIPLIKSLHNMGEYIIGQILILSPFFLGSIFIFLKKSGKVTVKENKENLNYLLFPLVFTWLFFFFVSIKKIEVNWLFFAYPSISVLLSNFYFNHQAKRSLYISIVATATIVILIFCPRVFDYLGVSDLYPPKIDTIHRMYGWQELGHKVSSLAKMEKQGKMFIFSDSYQVASELAFYVEDNPQTYCINTGRRMNQFDLWKGIDQFNDQGYNAIYVSSEAAGQNILNSFIGPVNHYVYSTYYRNNYLIKYHIYYLTGYKKFSSETINKF